MYINLNYDCVFYWYQFLFHLIKKFHVCLKVNWIDVLHKFNFFLQQRYFY